MRLAAIALAIACSLLGVCDAKTPPSNIDPQVLDQIEAVYGSNGANKKPEKNPKDEKEIIDPDYWDDDSNFKVSSLEYEKFDWNILKRISAGDGNNILLSPFNLKTALAILGEAGTGLTRREILDVLNYPLDRNANREKFAALLNSLSTPSPDYIVNLGSRIYVAKDVAPRQKYTAIAQEFYKTEVRNLNFENPRQAAAEVNAWVAEATKGHIEDLVTEEDIEEAVMLILTTIYFKGKWRHQFPKNQTTPNNFYLNSTRQVSVPMMYQKAKFFYYDSSNLECKILRMPYLGNKFAMYILLPNAVNGLDDLVKNMFAHKLRTELFLLREETVKVTLPQIKFDFLSQLAPILKEMGIREAFQDTASFPGIARGRTLASSLRVSNVIQKAGIEISEIGSTAYAATEVSLVNKFGGEEDLEVDFFVNKPFVFYIEDESTRQILFIGTVKDPQQMKGLLDDGPSPAAHVPDSRDQSVVPLAPGKPAAAVRAPSSKPVAGGSPPPVSTGNRFGEVEEPQPLRPASKASRPVASLQPSRPPLETPQTTAQRQTGWWYYFSSDWI